VFAGFTGLLLGLGCGDGAAGPDATEPDVGEPDIAQVDVEDTATGPDLLTVVGRVVEASSASAVVGAVVCPGDDEAACETTGGDGAFSFDVEPGPLVLSVQSSGHRPARTVVEAAFGGMVTLPMVSDQLWSEQEIGAGVNGEAGILARFEYVDSDGGPAALAGVTVQLAAYSGIGAIYDLGGDAGPGVSTVDDGQGLFIDAVEGPQTIVASHAGGACLPAYGTEGNGLIVDALADIVSVVAFDCVVVASDRVIVSGGVTSEQTGAAMGAVEVCFEASDGVASWCAYTGPEGDYLLNDLPPDALGVLRVTPAGFYPSLTPLDTGSGRTVPVVVSVAGVPRVLVAQPFDPTLQGVVVMTAYDDGSVADGDLAAATTTEGASIGLLPGAGVGPFYLAEPGLYSPIAPATFDPGVGVILNLPVGTYSAKFEHPWGTCWLGNGLPSEADMTFAFTVEAGTDTRLVALCDADVPETATIIGRIVNGLDLQEALEGGTVCVIEKNETTGEYDEDVCATADQNGDFELVGAPANTSIRLRSSSPGFDANDYIVNSAFGLTHESRLTPSVMKSYLYEPVVAAGRCEAMADYVTYDGKGIFSARVYDSAYNTDTFHQGLWTDRAKLHIERVDGEGPDLGLLYWDNYLVNLAIDESTRSNGGIMTCAIPPGLHRITFTHPWGACQVGYGNESEPDGTFLVDVVPANILSVGGECTLDPPGTLAEELASYPPVASTHPSSTLRPILPTSRSSATISAPSFSVSSFATAAFFSFSAPPCAPSPPPSFAPASSALDSCTDVDSVASIIANGSSSLAAARSSCRLHSSSKGP